MSSARSETGQATVELALVLPFLVALALGLVQLTLVLRDQLALIAAVREAARVASVDPDPHAAQAAAEAVLPGIAVRFAGARRPGRQLTVVAGYRSRTEVPVVGPLLPDRQLQARAVMRVER